jgi:hypothetical protein
MKLRQLVLLLLLLLLIVRPSPRHGGGSTATPPGHIGKVLLVLELRGLLDLPHCLFVHVLVTLCILLADAFIFQEVFHVYLVAHGTLVSFYALEAKKTI